MSWWDTGNGDDVIGDQPADLVRDALKELVAETNKQSKERPALAQLLLALLTIAQQDAGKQLADTPADLSKIVAECESGEIVTNSPQRQETDQGDLLGPLKNNLGLIGKVYEDRWKRKPRFSEWLETFAFVLRYRPQDYLSDGAEHPLQSIKT